MENSYNSIEENFDREIKRKKRMEELEYTIDGLTQDQGQDGFSDEQEFLISYYGLDKEKCKNSDFDINNIGTKTSDKEIVPRISRDELEEKRHEALLDLFFATKDFNKDEVNMNRDIFHDEIVDWNQYSNGFEENPLIVKKMINLQTLNRMAHQYQTLFKMFIDVKNPQLKIEESEIEMIREMLTSKITRISENAKQNLINKFGEEKVALWQKDKYLNYTANASRWMFNEKNYYIRQIVTELQNNEEEYNYGIQGNNGIIFEVPGYGQFGVHMGKEILRELKEIKGLKDYDGLFLGNVYLLSKANPELLKNVNIDELSDEDKQRYKIVSSVIKRDNIEEKKDKTSENVEELIEKNMDKEKSREMIDILREEGINPEKLKLDTIIKKGNPEAMKDIIETIKSNQYGIGMDIFYRCNTLLGCNTEKAIDVMLMFDKINKLGIDVKELVNEYPNFLTVSKSDKMEEIYNVLKEYKIDLTYHNIGVAFEGNAQNIKKNMDLLIENGLYDLAKVGENKFFTSNNKKLNMRINLFKQQNEDLIVENKDKRKINNKLFLTEANLMSKYGISKKEILDELEKIKGQELIKNNKYYTEEESKEIKLSNQQQEISNSIFGKLNENKTEDGMVIKIGDYSYSAIKVKEQIGEIIAKGEIQDLENEDINEILKLALFKGKNIDSKEVEEVSAQIEILAKKEPLKEVQENEEKANIEEQEEVQDNTEYDEIKEATNDIVEKQQNIEDIEQIISNLKEVRKTLKHQIKEMEEKLNKTILENDEPNSEIIQDIKELRRIVVEQKQKRKEVKQMIKRYKRNIKTMKYTLKQQKEKRNNSIDELEI